MAYLTYEEYQAMAASVVEVTEEEFPRLLSRASESVDSITYSFYQFNDLETDTFLYRKNQFKKAIAAQLDYFADNDGVSSYQVSSANTVSIGRTSISNGSPLSASGNPTKEGTTSYEVFMYLRDTGLLYRAIGRC